MVHMIVHNCTYGHASPINDSVLTSLIYMLSNVKLSQSCIPFSVRHCKHKTQKAQSQQISLHKALLTMVSTTTYYWLVFVKFAIAGELTYPRLLSRKAHPKFWNVGLLSLRIH